MTGAPSDDPVREPSSQETVALVPLNDPVAVSSTMEQEVSPLTQNPAAKAAELSLSIEYSVGQMLIIVWEVVRLDEV